MGRALSLLVAGAVLAVATAGCAGTGDPDPSDGRTSRNARDATPLIQFLPADPPLATYLVRERGHVASLVDGQPEWSDWSLDDANVVYYGVHDVQDAFGRTRQAFLFRYDVMMPSATEGHVAVPSLYWIDSASGEFLVRRDLVHGDWFYAWDEGGGLLAPSYVGALLGYLLVDARAEAMRSPEGAGVAGSTYRLTPSEDAASSVKGCSGEALDWVGPVQSAINVTLCLGSKSELPLRVRAWHDRLTYTADFVHKEGPVPHAKGAQPPGAPEAPTRGWLTTFGSGVPYSVAVPPVSTDAGMPEYAREYAEAATRGYNFAAFQAVRGDLYLARLQFNTGPISQSVPLQEGLFRSYVYIGDGGASYYTFIDTVEAQDQRVYSSTSSGTVSTTSVYGAGMEASSLPETIVPLQALQSIQESPLPEALRWVWSIGRSTHQDTPAHAWWAVSGDCLSDDHAEFAILSAVNGQRLVQGPAVPPMGIHCRLRTP